MRVRLLKDAGTAYGNFPAGHILDVPTETARHWLETGLAMEDKSMEPKETKAVSRETKAVSRETKAVSRETRRKRR